MRDVYIIMGTGGSKKSATVRALTGVYKRDIYNIAITEQNVIRFFVQISSLQEQEIDPQKFINEMNERKCSNILLTLWISKKIKRNGTIYPDGSTYIQNFIDAGWTIREIVVLNRETQSNRLSSLPQGTSNINYVDNTDNLAANFIASQIRGWWGWL